MDLDLLLALFSGALIVFSAFSTFLQRASLPGPLLSLAFGILVGPHALGLVRMEDFGVPEGTLLEQAARITLAVGLAGVALRLPHGYWLENVRWIAVVIGIGMIAMFFVATGIMMSGLGLPLLMALLLAAIVTPTDPVVTTPIVTGSLAEQKVSGRVRHNLSAESGVNDGLGYLFVMLPVLLLTDPDNAWQELLGEVLLKEVLGAAVFGAVAGYLLGMLFVLARTRGLMEESSYLAFILPLALFLLGVSRLLDTDAILAVFVGVAVFGQVIPQRAEAEEDKIQDAVARLFLLPVFILLGIALPLTDWAGLGWGPLVVIAAAVVLRRVVTIWVLRPLLKGVYDLRETAFVSWFAPVGISALLYATVAQRHTGDPDVFVYATMAITLSVVIHGLSSAPLSAWLHDGETRADQEHGEPAR
ncbi:MAG: cation:proton antiporter [Dermatophilaceae bacterium]